MSNNNSVVPFQGATVKDLAEAAGIAEFFGEAGWFITISGLIIQGGQCTTPGPDNTTVRVDFNKAFNQECKGIWLQAIFGMPSTAVQESDGVVLSGSVDTTGFTAVSESQGKTYYWWAIGT